MRANIMSRTIKKTDLDDERVIKYFMNDFDIRSYNRGYQNGFI